MTTPPVQDSDPGLTPAPLMALAAGLWGFKTLAAAIEVGLFDLLADGHGATAHEAAAKLGIEGRPADIFLTACASLGLLTKSGGSYHNSEVAEEFLVTGRANYFGDYVTYLDRRHYPLWAGAANAIRTNRPATAEANQHGSVFLAREPVMTQNFWNAMHSLGSTTAAALARHYDFGRHKRLLDVGGGAGTFSIALCGQYPQLRATVLDLEFTQPMAAAKIEQAGLAGVVTAVPGDFQADEELPAGHDVLLLSSVLHDWDESAGRDLLRKCFAALPSGGVIVVCELLLDDDHTGPAPAALMGMVMLLQTTGGRNYSAAEYSAWLTDTGFRDLRLLRLDAPSCDRALIAHKP
jgi:SAM-dependent methyltransferase